MSQEKVNKYKQEKANRKQTLAKAKVKSTIAKVCGSVVGLALVVWIAVSAVYFVIDNRPVDIIYANTGAITDYFKDLYEEETEGTESTETSKDKEDKKDTEATE